MLVGAALVVDRASLFDDAFVSFRYAEHAAAGHGFVWNLGERVQGYTNVLWTAAIAAGVAGTGRSAVDVALVLGAASWLALLAAVATASAALTRRPDGSLPAVPLALVLVATERAIAAFGTSGMETALAAALVVGMGRVLIERPTPRTGALAGALGIAATLTRPDLSLVYVVGGAVLLTEAVRDRRFGPVVAYAGPFAVWGSGRGGPSASTASCCPTRSTPSRGAAPGGARACGTWD